MRGNLRRVLVVARLALSVLLPATARAAPPGRAPQVSLVGLALLAALAMVTSAAMAVPSLLSAADADLRCKPAWHVQRSPNRIESIAALSSEDVWAVGQDGRSGAPLIERWNGRAFVRSTLAFPSRPRPPFTGRGELMDVSGSSPSDVWAVGWLDRQYPASALGVILHWNGRAWKVVPTRAELIAVSAISPTDAWGVGNGLWHWDEQAWRLVRRRSGPVVALSARTAHDVWGVGYFDPGLIVNQESYAGHWDGHVWRPTPTIHPYGGDDRLEGVLALAANDVWAVGEYGEGQEDSRPLIERWNGRRWTLVPVPPALDGGTNVIAGKSPTDIWIAGSNVIAHWDGTAWTASTAPANNTPFLTTISEVSPTEVWAAGGPDGGPNFIVHYSC
jgi:hypothetical protein